LSEIATEPDEVALSRPRLRALIPADRPVRAGERLVLNVEAGRTHFFDLESENAIA
jgi:multiple sugar transport system ATP-binding protein